MRPLNTYFAPSVCVVASLSCAAPLVSSLAFAQAVAQPAVQSVPPIAQWNFDEGQGTAAADANGKNAGTLTGAAGWGTGIVGAHSLKLPGRSDSSVDVARPVVDTTRSYTVTACVKLNRTSGYQTFVSIDGERISGFFFQFRDDTNEFALTVPSSDSTSGPSAIANSQVAPDPNVWYHLAGVYDASAQTVSLYVNGVLQETVPCKSAWRATGHTAIGRGKFNGNEVDFVDGEIDAVRVYDSPLSAPSVLSLARADLPAALLNRAQEPLTPASLTIQADKTGPRVDPMLYGLMTEEINYSYDGGLYGELIRNRQFKNNTEKPTSWSLVEETGAGGSMVLDKTDPVKEAQGVSLKLTIDRASGNGGRVGVANEGYWGIPVKPNTTYKASLWAKAAPPFSGPLTVAIESADGKTVYATGKTGALGGAWKQYAVSLKTSAGIAPTKDARFVIYADRPGTVNLSLVSLFPPTYKNRANGNRPDLMEKMAQMKQKFLRLPGGNYLEGDTIETRFPWKQTLGPVVDRPGHQGTWGYRSTDGMGLMEFLLWCEELNVEPILAVYAGYSLRGAHVDPGPKLEPFVQEALDEIEYLTGDAKTTKWGAVRAQNGHPKPFALRYVEIGNEDWFDKSGSYDGRFAQFYDAIKAKYPNLQLIATDKVKLRKPDLLDEHYYKPARAFMRDVHHYDNYDRSGPKIFVGEWASQEGRPTPNLNSALGDAAWLTGIERNADIVLMECYAPLLVNVNPGGSQWGTNLIGYDALTSYGSPSYYVQAMFAGNVGDTVVPTTLAGRQLYASVTRDTKKNVLFVKVVNGANAAQTVKMAIDGAKGVATTAQVTTLSGAKPTDTNTLAAPTNIVPVTKSVGGVGKTFDYTFPPYSVTVLRLQHK